MGSVILPNISGKRRHRSRGHRHRSPTPETNSVDIDIFNKTTTEPPTTTTTAHIPREVSKLQKYFPNVQNPKPADVQWGCKEIRSKKYISDGFCTSIKPITEVVCTGHCLPIDQLPWYAEFIKVWAKNKALEFRCVEDVKRRKRVTLMCENGETRMYRIKVVKSCKCKRYTREENRSPRRRRHHHDELDYEEDYDIDATDY